MRDFDFMEFSDGTDLYGIMFDASRYSKDHALVLAKHEFKYLLQEDLQVTEDYVHWVGNISKEDRDHYGLELNGTQGCYMSCKKEDKGAFECWRVFYS